MKLTKTKLIKLLKPNLEELGFTEFKDTIIGAQGFFAKKLKNGLYLTLGMTIHRYYDSAFTGDFYLSKTTRWASVWGDIPNESYKRPGRFLTDEERSIYPEDEINVKGAYDIWWDGSDEKSIADFIRVIKLTEPRVINQPELIEKINESHQVKILARYAEKVKELVRENQTEGDFIFLPTKEVDGISLTWFKASEKVLRENEGILNSNTVKLLAADAYRQYQLDALP